MAALRDVANEPCLEDYDLDAWVGEDASAQGCHMQRRHPRQADAEQQ